ncbi:glutathione S-transferase family protein [Neorhizobium alkalisoli]|uniref:glutathione S-transferase family protein n=1 Tax=Neorhizobium alkalisoli TaxID=528178 RepID=UPI000CF9D113|nr:glutathione binding-like protein [Neorhizobium alkalisoli]
MIYTLHAAPGSCSLAPHIVLEEIGVPYHLALISTDKGDARTEEFRRFNPKGRIPVLTGKNFFLTEAPAILLHLAQTSPTSNLLESGQESFIRAVEWFNWLSGTVHAVAVRMIWRSEYFLDDASYHPAIVAKGHEHLMAAFSLIEAKMKDRPWTLGSRYSVVDPYLLVFNRWGNRMKIDMQRDYPAWTDHAKRLADRKAVQAALSQEGIALWE